MQSELCRQAEILFGPDLKRSAGEAPRAASPADPSARASEPRPALGVSLTSRQTDRLWRHVESIDGFWQSLQEIEAGSVGPWEPGGISPFQYEAGRKKAEAEGRVYESFGATPK